jgi:hypothetical protein
MIEMFELEKGVKIGIKPVGEVAEQGVTGGGGRGESSRTASDLRRSPWGGGSGATPTIQGEGGTDVGLDLEERPHRPRELVLDERDTNEAAG